MVVTGSSLIRRPQRSLGSLLAKATWQINEQNSKHQKKNNFQRLAAQLQCKRGVQRVRAKGPPLVGACKNEGFLERNARLF